MIPVKYELDGEVNSTEFEIRGEGRGSVADGSLEMDLSLSEIPDGWAPETFQTICCGGTHAYFCKGQGDTPDFADLVHETYEVSPRRHASIVDEDGREIARFEATTEAYFEDGHLVSKNSLVGESELPTIERVITPIEDVILPNGRGRCTALITYAMDTVEGDRLLGTTTIPYKTDTSVQLDSPIHRRITTLNTDVERQTMTTEFAAEMKAAEFALDSRTVSGASAGHVAPSDD